MAAPPATPVVVIAHRGDADHAPENTAAAFRAAIAADARVVETDVQLSADGVLFLLHDDAPTRTTDSARQGIGEETVAETLTWAELATLDAGGWFGPKFAGEPIPLLRDLGELLAAERRRGADVGLDLEIKPPLTHAVADVVDAVARELAQPCWGGLLEAGEVVVTSFDPEVVTVGMERLPVPVGLITAATPTPAEIAEIAEVAVVGALITEQADLTPEAVAAAHAAGLPVGVYTVNAPDWERMLALGVDAICTDDPGGLRAFLAQ